MMVKAVFIELLGGKLAMITLVIALAAAPVLPWLDRRELEAAAKVEATRAAQKPELRLAAAGNAPKPRLATASVAPKPRLAAPANPPKPQLRLAAAVDAPKPPVVRAAIPPREALVRDLKAVSSFCQASTKVDDQQAFFSAVSEAFDMSRAEAATLRDRCAVYLMGHRDGRASR
jgi:hypothetical protein